MSTNCRSYVPEAGLQAEYNTSEELAEGMVKESHRDDFRTVLVPVDFTAVSDQAMITGNALAGFLQAPLKLMHVITTHEQGAREHRVAIEKKLRSQFTRLVAEKGFSNVDVTIAVHSGNLFETIGNTERYIKPTLIVMGTHGKRGLQHLFGSHALRVVIDADCPVMVVQKQFDPFNYGCLIVPQLCENPCPELVRWVLKMAGDHDREVILVRIWNDASIWHTPVRVSQSGGLSGILSGAGVKVRCIDTDPDEDPAMQILELAMNEGADLIMSMTMPDDPAAGLSFSRWNEKLMFNSGKIPVLFFNNAGSGH